MTKIDITVESAVSTSIRARQIGAMFDAPVSEKCRLHWELDFPIEDEPWQIGLVVGPSGAGKSTVMKHVWGEQPRIDWNAASVVDDFAKTLSTDKIAEVCSAVGFNTIPAWMRPFRVLSNGEQFRVDLARRLLELPDPIVVDEFTSVVDRQIAQIGAHAVQKYVRRNGRQFVAVTCHYDVLDWLQPDWVLDMATRSFTRRRLQRRPSLDVVVGRVPRAAWSLFAPFHYMTASLVNAARCFGLWANGRLAAFAGMMHMVHPSAKAQRIMRCSRLVTLPDWQGLGLAMALIDEVAAGYAGIDKRAHTYPAHPALIKTFAKSPKWNMVKEAGYADLRGTASTVNDRLGGDPTKAKMGARPCAVFEYVGPSLPKREAERLIGWE